MLLAKIADWSEDNSNRRLLTFILLFLGAMAFFGLGIWEHTGVTGKDEYYLGLRTPMCMVEQDVWLVPCLDGEPRLKKPPMLYWLTRASYEVFGVSLFGARLVAVTLASLLVLATVLIALELDFSLARALLAGLIALSFLGLSVGGRILELDVPVAAFSTLAFYALLRWFRRGEAVALPLAVLALVAGFLTKGPVVFVVCGAGGLVLLAFEARARSFLTRRWLQVSGAVFLFVLLVLPWFLYVNQLYPELSTQILSEELAARDFFQLSPAPLYGILMLILPWSFVALVRLNGIRHLPEQERRQALMLLTWMALTLLPFFFIRTFERYLYGSLVPMALLLAQPWVVTDSVLRWAARLGLGLSLLLTLPVYGVALWINGSVSMLVVVIPLLGWFILQWWHAKRIGPMALSAVLLWSATLGLVYPKLGINKIPPHIVEQTRDRQVIFYHGPQPGLLPAVLGRSLRLVDEHWRLPDALVGSCEPFLLFAEEDNASMAVQGVGRQGLDATELERFGVLSARVSWLRMARRGVTVEGVLEGFKHKDLEPIKPQVVLFQVSNPQCPVD